MTLLLPKHCSTTTLLAELLHQLHGNNHDRLSGQVQLWHVCSGVVAVGNVARTLATYRMPVVTTSHTHSTLYKTSAVAKVPPLTEPHNSVKVAVAVAQTMAVNRLLSDKIRSLLQTQRLLFNFAVIVVVIEARPPGATAAVLHRTVDKDHIKICVKLAASASNIL